MKRLFIKGLVLSLTIIGISVLPSLSTPLSVEAAGSLSSSNLKYADYKTGQYWSADMLWAIDYGLISGFKGEKNAKTGKVENYLKPYGNLTEAQMIAVLFRYAKPEELAATKSVAPNWFASASYQLAAKYKIPTKASLQNTKPANQTVTRGELAKAMASLYKGNTVNGKEAVQFMYEADLSTGLPDAKGKYPQTYESYGINEKLTRANLVSFMKRYDAFLQTTGQQPNKPIDIEPSQGNVVDGIKVRYGKHTYGSLNQTEYNVVMTAVDKALKTDYGFTWEETGVGDKYYEEYLNGAKPIRDRSDPDVRSERNSFLIVADGKLRALMDAGISPNTIREVNKIKLAGDMLLKGKKDPGTGAPRSAYDAIAKDLADCDPIAQVYSAVFDASGYNTAILTRPGHAIGIVQIDGNWIDVTGGGYTIVNPYSLISQGNKVLVQPTKGGTLK